MAHQQAKSIYSTRSHRPSKAEIVAPTGGQSDTRPFSPRPALPPDCATDWSALRKVQPVNYLLPLSIAWLRTLPTGVRPMALVAKYPRIANAIALDWDRPAACRAYLTDLLVDHRGARKGFPADVHRDLTTLRDHYYGHSRGGLGLQLVE